MRTDKLVVLLESNNIVRIGTRNISYERFQNGCVLKDPLSAFVCFFQHDSGIVLSENYLREVRKALAKFK